MENSIGAYLDDYARLDEPGVSLQLYDLVQTYPWFTLGRYMQLRSLRTTDPAGYNRVLRRTDVRLFVHPWPRLLLDDETENQPLDLSGVYASPDAYDAAAYNTSFPDTNSVIDDFLNSEGDGERIVPPPADVDIPQEDISLDSVADDGEIATETLAEIYLAQGLPDRAVEIYYKLSLKYPEKSTYFADLIADVQARYGLQ